MNQETLWVEFSTLPPHAQSAVLEFMAFMQNRYHQTQEDISINESTNIMDDPFIGMWRDHEDMEDSTVWVRNIRKM